LADWHITHDYSDFSSMIPPPIKIIYAVQDYFPPWRLDVAYLFGDQLPGLGATVTWSMWRDKPGPCQSCVWQGQRVLLPMSAGRSSRGARIISRLTHSVCDVLLFFRMLFGERYDIVQVRDVRYVAAFFGWLVARIRGSKFTYWLSYPSPEHCLELARGSHGLSRAVKSGSGLNIQQELTLGTLGPGLQNT
jgi:hypothetical protein